MRDIQQAQGWGFLEHFRPPEAGRTELARLAPWLAQLDTRLSAGLVALTSEQELWGERLADLGGDPTAFDFESFRPLRISREEDWSDWLAHLLQTSAVGAFARDLFDGDCATTVIREAPLGAGARRADLLCRWSTDRAATHVEVKVGDDAFEKTFETAELVEAEHGETRWRNFVLVLPQQLPQWHRIAGNRQTVVARSWADVGLALRRQLWTKAEPIVWRVWALTFCGAIEQVLLGFPRQTTLESRRLEPAILQHLSLLRTARSAEGTQ